MDGNPYEMRSIFTCDYLLNVYIFCDGSYGAIISQDDDILLDSEYDNLPALYIACAEFIASREDVRFSKETLLWFWCEDDFAEEQEFYGMNARVV